MSQWLFLPHAHKTYAGQCMRAALDAVDWSTVQKIVGFSTNHYLRENKPDPREHSWNFLQDVLSEYTNIKADVTFYGTAVRYFGMASSDTLYICNSDLVHSESEKKEVMIEAEKTIKYMMFYKDHDKPSDTACGTAAMETFRNFMSNRNLWPSLMSYYLSPGPRYVGYASIIYRDHRPSIYNLFGPAEKNILSSYAKAVIKKELYNRSTNFSNESPEVIIPSFLWIGSRTEYGIFVTVTTNRKLRGCVGTLMFAGFETILQKIEKYALKAVFEDSRFYGQQLTYGENFDVTIGVLESGNETTIEQWNYKPGLQGVSLFADGRSAFFLPEVTERFGKIELLSELCLKMGLKDLKCFERGSVILYDGVGDLRSPLA